MNKRILSAVLAVALVLSLVSCEQAMNIMGKMGNNVAGVDTAKVETAVQSVTVSEEKKTEVETKTQKTIDDKEVENASTFKYTSDDGEAKELYTVGTTKKADGTTDKNVLGIGGSLIEIPEDSNVDLSEVKSVLPPQDISSISENLSSSNKEETLKMLDAVVEDTTTKEAAEGTKKVVQVLLEAADDLIDDDSTAESSKKSKEIIETVLTNMENADSEIKMGDVVVLQALTNLICEAPDEIASIVKSKDTSSSADEEKISTKDAATKLLEEANDTIIATAEILNTVSSSTTIFEGIDLSTLVGLVMSSTGTGSTEGK